jgi:hypothetical protein
MCFTRCYIILCRDRPDIKRDAACTYKYRNRFKQAAADGAAADKIILVAALPARQT